MVTSLSFGGISLSSTSCNGGAESDVLLGLVAGAESETSSVLALEYLLLVSIISYTFWLCVFLDSEVFWVFFSIMSVSHNRKGSSFMPLKLKVGNGCPPLVWERGL